VTPRSTPRRVAAPTRAVATHAGDPLARAVADASQLLDVDVDQLARPLALIALGRREAQPAELAHPAALEHRADRRRRKLEQLGELRAREPQPA
jgi:hypothetical protein